MAGMAAGHADGLVADFEVNQPDIALEKLPFTGILSGRSVRLSTSAAGCPASRTGARLLVATKVGFVHFLESPPNNG